MIDIQRTVAKPKPDNEALQSSKEEVPPSESQAGSQQGNSRDDANASTPSDLGSDGQEILSYLENQAQDPEPHQAENRKPVNGVPPNGRQDARVLTPSSKPATNSAASQFLKMPVKAKNMPTPSPPGKARGGRAELNSASINTQQSLKAPSNNGTSSSKKQATVAKYQPIPDTQQQQAARSSWPMANGVHTSAQLNGHGPASATTKVRKVETCLTQPYQQLVCQEMHHLLHPNSRTFALGLCMLKLSRHFTTVFHFSPNQSAQLMHLCNCVQICQVCRIGDAERQSMLVT